MSVVAVCDDLKILNAPEIVPEAANVNEVSEATADTVPTNVVPE